ncbi:UPF0114 domain-containing protein [Melia azedarach]|uniref:UPF0114 domain-containing protein n=1 Tax=Melia azedarach TaxID=155640 RepID=A0ACC1Z0Z5_MELAZ|nr:UPF0114 domain-containing protein [Melia azedarach]
MKPSRPLITRPIKPSPAPVCFTKSCKFSCSNAKRVFDFQPSGIKFPLIMTTKGSRNEIHLPASTHSSSPVITSNMKKLEAVEENIEKVIYGCRFMTLLGVFGSLIGSFLCFIKGCTYVVASFAEYFVNRGKVILLLVEAIDVYLLGTVMLVFGMGLYELFVSNLDIAKLLSKENAHHRSNLFGLFALKERPRWLEIKSVNELKTKLGHVIVMLLLIGLFDKSKKAVIHSPLDLLCFATSVLLSSGCLFLLSKLNGSK